MMAHKDDCEPDDIETCLADSRLRDDQRHLLAVMLRWQRVQIAALRTEHQVTDRRIEDLDRALQYHLKEDVPEIQSRLNKIDDALFNDDNGLVHIRRWLCTVSRWAAALIVAAAGIVTWVVDLWTHVPTR